MPGLNNTMKKNRNLQNELKRKLNKRRAEVAATEVSVSSKTNKTRKNTILNNPICKNKSINNAFTCARMIERNKELNALRSSKSKSITLKTTPLQPTTQELTPTFVESATGKKVLWKGKVKKQGDEYLFFPSGCVDKETPGANKIIFTYKGKEYPKWCTTRKRRMV